MSKTKLTDCRQPEIYLYHLVFVIPYGCIYLNIYLIIIKAEGKRCNNGKVEYICMNA
jgi:hypothetical protein